MDLMNKSSLLVLHNYNSHANSTVLETAVKLDEQSFTKPSSPSHGSVQALLTHMLTTEFFFLARCEGKPINSKPGAPPLSIAEIGVTFAQIAKERRKYLDWVSEDLLSQEIIIPIIGQDIKLARWQFLTQSLMHSAHHRGELSIVLTGLGYPLPTLDIIIEFVQETGQKWPCP